MSYFDDASLVMIPSGYKTSKVYSVKPTDGTGDLTFTRSNDTATRVGPDGLIEKVRTNLVTYSNDFSNAAWVNVNTTETSGQAGYDGTNNAWLLSKSAVAANIGQTVGGTGLLTQSVYAKAGTLNWFVMNNSGLTATGVYFDLQNGVIGEVGANVTSSSIEAVGGGWYRCSVTFIGTSSAFRIFPADADGDVSGTSGNILIQAAQLEVGDIMTDYIATTSAAVSVGPVANVPRLDYLNSSCPRLLLEPQRTNKNIQSEFFNTWYTFSAQTATDNAALSPEGVQNAALLERTSSSGNSRLQTPIVSVASGASVVHSIFLKAHTANNVIMYSPQGGEGKKFDLTAGTAGDDFISAPDDYGIEPYADGWYRIWIVSTMPGTSAQCWVYIDEDDTTGFYAYGFQTEEGSYPTSYIPTYGAAVTRGADAASKTGISSLIGQTEGTLFVEYDFDADKLNNGGSDNDIINLKNSSNGDFIKIVHYGDGSSSFNKKVYLYTKYSSVFEVTIISGVQTSGRMKVAAAYKANDFVLYVNGVQIGTDNSGSVPTCDTLYLGKDTGTVQVVNPRYQALLFPTRLSNADLAALTA